jgi:hypothetical protein
MVGYQVMNGEMHGACSMYGRDAYKILVGGDSEYLGVDGRIILEWILGK